MSEKPIINPKGDNALRDMSSHGWTKNLTWKELSIREDGKIEVIEYDFYSSNLPCPRCATDRFTWIVPQRAGVYKACLYCGVVNGPISMDTGVKQKTYEISSEEAVKILLGRGWTLRDKKLRPYLRRKKPTELVPQAERPKVSK